MSNNSTASGGIGLAGIIGVVFVILKLTDLIDWPWIWVLAPFWIPLAIAVLFIVLAILIGAARP